MVRKLVRATHRWPLLGSVYRGVYKAAADSVVHLAEQNPGMAGIYARNSYALGTWEPGRSDIDLTVVWREPSQEAVDRFHLSYARLQDRFPMLGEVEMLDERHLDAWTSHGFTGLQSRNWKKLGGDHKLRCRYTGSEPEDRIHHAVAIYRYQFLRYFWEQPRSETTIQRTAAKLMRALGKPMVSTRNAGELLTVCLKELSRAVKDLPVGQRVPLVDYRSLVGNLLTPSRQGRSAVRAPHGVHSVIAAAQERVPKHLLVSNGFAVEQIESVFRGAIIMNEDVFRFYLCSVDPLEYFSLLRERTILHGEDPLREPFPLSQTGLRDAICRYSVDMLTYPYRKELSTIPCGEFKDLLYGWFLRTLRYFEDGFIDFDYHMVRQYFENRHTEGASRFSLLHSIANELSDHLCVERCKTFAQTSS